MRQSQAIIIVFFCKFVLMVQVVRTVFQCHCCEQNVDQLLLPHPTLPGVAEELENAATRISKFHRSTTSLHKAVGDKKTLPAVKYHNLRGYLSFFSRLKKIFKIFIGPIYRHNTVQQTYT